MASSVRIVIFPLFRRNWIFHTVITKEPLQKTSDELLANEGSILGKMSAYLKKKAQDIAHNEWNRMENASKRSIRGLSYRFATWTLSKREPMVTFLGSIPRSANGMEVIYPAGLPERMVRRRLRMLAMNRKKELKSRERKWWGFAAASMPLFILPITNIPLYWSIYQLYLARKAIRGAGVLEEFITSWEGLNRVNKPFHANDHLKAYSTRELGSPMRFHSSRLLSDLVDLDTRQSLALSQTEIASIGQVFGGCEELLELAERARSMG